MSTTVTLSKRVKPRHRLRGEAIEEGSLVHWEKHPEKPLGVILTSKKNMQTAQVFWVAGIMQHPSTTSWIRKSELKRVEGE